MLAAVVRSYFVVGEIWWDHLADGGRFLMVVTLFLIGGGLTRESLARIGMRPLVAAVVLWLIVSVLSLTAVIQGWVSIEFPG